MAVTPALKSGSKAKIFQLILKSMGYNDVSDLIHNITVAAGTPDTELSGMHDWSLVWDSTNNVPYLHTTGTHFTAIGQAIVFKDGYAMNRQSSPNG